MLGFSQEEIDQLEPSDINLIFEAKRQNEQSLAKIAFSAIDYKLLREACPTDKQGKVKTEKRNRLQNEAENLKNLYQYSYQELLEYAKKKQEEEERNKQLASLDLTKLKYVSKRGDNGNI